MSEEQEDMMFIFVPSMMLLFFIMVFILIGVGSTGRFDIRWLPLALWSTVPFAVLSVWSGIKIFKKEERK